MTVDTLPSAVRTFFAHTSPRIILVATLAPLVARVSLGGFVWLDMAIAAAIVPLWAFQEWAAHRWILHLRPRPGFDPGFARAHRAHHREPDDIPLILLPPSVPLGAIPVNAAVWLLVFPVPQALTGIAAYSAMALLYEWTHFLTHTRYRPSSGLVQQIFRFHRLHHFKNEGYWFGFIVPWIDVWLGTAPDPKDVPTSHTARDPGGGDVR